MWVLATTALCGCGGSTDPGSSTDAAGDVATDSGSTDGVAIDSSGRDVTTDASTDGGACFDETGSVPSVPFKVCANDDDCTTATHETDCCGNSQIIGVSKSQAAAYAACEKPWDEHFPGCGCAGGPPKTEDGKTATDPSAVIVKCTDRTGTTGICRTSLP